MHDKKKFKIKFISILIFLSIVFISCNSENEKSNFDFKVEKINSEQLKELISEKNSKILFLNVWATWCSPCREEFPKLVKLSNKLSNTEFIGLSVDDPSEIDSNIIPYLKTVNARFKVYVYDDSPEELINLLNPKWNGGIPATFIYNKERVQKEFILGSQSYSFFENKINAVK